MTKSQRQLRLLAKQLREQYIVPYSRTRPYLAALANGQDEIDHCTLLCFLAFMPETWQLEEKYLRNQNPLTLKTEIKTILKDLWKAQAAKPKTKQEAK